MVIKVCICTQAYDKYIIQLFIVKVAHCTHVLVTRNISLCVLNNNWGESEQATHARVECTQFLYIFIYLSICLNTILKQRQHIPCIPVHPAAYNIDSLSVSLGSY